MNKLAFLIGLLLVSACVFAEDTVVETEKVATTEGAAPTQEDTGLGEAGETKEAFQQRIHDLYISCIIASRFQLERKDDIVTPLLNSVDDLMHRINLYKKILAEHIYHCGLSATKVPTIPAEITKQVLEKTFKIEEWDILFMDIFFEKYKNPTFDVTLTDAEEKIMQFVEKFEKAMSDKNSEPKLGSFSMNSMSPVTQVIYTILIIGVFGALIYFGYKFSKETPLKVKKSKKDKKKSD